MASPTYLRTNLLGNASLRGSLVASCSSYSSSSSSSSSLASSLPRLRYSSSALSFHQSTRSSVSTSRAISPSSSSLQMFRSTFSTATSSEEPELYDVAILGSGMVGTSFAAALGRCNLTRHLKVALIDTTPPPLSQEMRTPLTPHPDLRVSALNASSVLFLQALGVWDKLERMKAYQHMTVWDAVNTTGQISFSSPSSSPLGYIVENKTLTTALFDLIQTQCPNVTVLAPAKVESISTIGDDTADSGHLPPSWLRLQFNGKRNPIATRLLVGADGAESLARTSAGIGAVGWSYNQKAVVSAVRLDTPTETAWQRFLPNNAVLALLPMHENYASIVWSTHLAHADWLLGLSSEQFHNELQHAFVSHYETEGLISSLLQACPQPKPPQIQAVVGSRGAFPLRIAMSSSYVKPRLALIGDAAHTIHPLAGQGVNLGFGDAVALTNAMISAVETGRDLGDLTVLEEYESSVFKANSAMLSIVDGVKALFGSQFPPVVALRTLGLATSNQLTPLKDLFVRIASGEFTSGSLNQFLSKGLRRE